MHSAHRQGFLRVRDGEEAKVTNEELFFDLLYAFAITQLSHHLLQHLGLMTALETLVLWFAVWLGWQYTSWVTNWFNPEHLPMRLMLFALMLVGLLMSSAIPEAYAERGMVFALCYVAIQVGRTLFVLLHLGRGHALTPNFTRMLCWLCISGVLWIAGGLSEGHARLAFWIAAVACEYISPMTGFRIPGLGRSQTSDWTIDGAHLAERCQLFVIVALGESVLATGASISHSHDWNAPTLIALLVAFLASIGMWWVYFDTSSKDGTEAIVRSDDPGRIGAQFHYVHVTLIAGIIVSAVGNELIIEAPAEHVDMASASVLIGGPLLYLIGNAIYKRIVYGVFPRSHLAGLAALLVLLPLAFTTDRLLVGGLAAAILLTVAVWESCVRRSVAALSSTHG